MCIVRGRVAAALSSRACVQVSDPLRMRTASVGAVSPFPRTGTPMRSRARPAPASSARTLLRVKLEYSQRDQQLLQNARGRCASLMHAIF